MPMERSRFKTEAEEQGVSGQKHQATAQGKEFANVEEMLRLDATQVTPPSQLDERVKRSLEAEPSPKVAWWKKLFGQVR